jgi:hypothetical protein
MAGRAWTLRSSAREPVSSRVESLRLNRSEKLYLAFEGVSGSVTQVYGLRFAQPVSTEAIRNALRSVIRSHPRLRAVVEPTWLSHRLTIRPEGPELDGFFDEAFRVLPVGPTDDDALVAVIEAFLSESFRVARDLPIKAKLIPHPEKPALVLSIHHIAGDGRSVMGWIQALARALNGEVTHTKRVDEPNHGPAIVPRSVREAATAVTAFFRGAIRSNEAAPLLLPPLVEIEVTAVKES